LALLKWTHILKTLGTRVCGALKTKNTGPPILIVLKIPDEYGQSYYNTEILGIIGLKNYYYWRHDDL
jgi:hypothetical protein